MRAAIGLLWFLVAIFGAHALAYAVIRVMPDAATVALGIESAQEAARVAFAEEVKPRDYVQTVRDLFRGELGKTLDGVPVTEEMATALVSSTPRFLLASLIVFFIFLGVSIAPPRILGPTRYFGSLLSFFPPFLAPFLGFGILVSTNAVFNFASNWGAWTLCTFALALPPAAMISAQAAELTRHNLTKPFAITVRAMGASHLQQRYRLLRNLIAELAPTFEKLVVGMITMSLFAEPIFGEAGIGTTAIRAIRRTDPDLLLACVLLFALVINLARMASNAVQRSRGLRS